MDLLFDIIGQLDPDIRDEAKNSGPSPSRG